MQGKTTLNNKTIYCTQTAHQALRRDRHVSLALWSVTFGTLVAWGCIVVCKLTPRLSCILFCPLGRQVAYRNFITKNFLSITQYM